MQGSTIKSAFLALVLATALPLAACGDDNDTPTSPTQAGPPIANPAPTPAPEPTPTPTPTPTPDDGSAVTLNGLVNRMSRSGTDGVDVLFRVGDEPFVRGDANTVVIDGSARLGTSALRDGQTVTVEATQRGSDFYARRVTINTQP